MKWPVHSNCQQYIISSLVKYELQTLDSLYNIALHQNVTPDLRLNAEYQPHRGISKIVSRNTVS